MVRHQPLSVEGLACKQVVDLGMVYNAGEFNVDQLISLTRADIWAIEVRLGLMAAIRDGLNTEYEMEDDDGR
jgi:hypothetical protein